MNGARSGALTGQLSLSVLAVRCASPIRFCVKRERLIVVKWQVAPEVDTQLNHVALPALQRRRRKVEFDCGTVPRSTGCRNGCVGELLLFSRESASQGQQQDRQPCKADSTQSKRCFHRARTRPVSGLRETALECQ